MMHDMIGNNTSKKKKDSNKWILILGGITVFVLIWTLLIFGVTAR